MSYHAFISHTSSDKPLAEKLRQALSAYGVKAWLDARELTGGDELPKEIREQIDSVPYFIVLLSIKSLNSDWVSLETDWALARGERITIIPVVLENDEIRPVLIKRFLNNRDLKSLPLTGVDGVQELMPHLLNALGRRLPSYEPPSKIDETQPVEELVLYLDQCAMVETDGKRRGRARAKLEYLPTHGGEKLRSRGYSFESPLGPIEMEELSWYLERFPRWPGEAFRGRAQRVENSLPQWGKELFDAVLGTTEASKIRDQWLCSSGEQRRFTVMMEELLPTGDTPPDEETQKGLVAAAHLLGMPWELLHAPVGYLFQGAKPVRVRRGLRNEQDKPPFHPAPPLRVLMLSPRPEDEQAGYIDHRVTARPLAETLSALGDLAELTILADPSVSGLMTALQKAKDAKKPYHVVHFDGHGVYLRDQGLGALCFEEAGQSELLFDRKTEIVKADDLAQRLTDYRIPLFFLEACQSAQAEINPSGSVAAMLLDRGVAAVAAMSHSVLVVTAKEFVTVFYRELAQGARVGEAMLAGQRHLFENKKRGHYIGAGALELHDWFVPVLFQEREDRPLVHNPPSKEAKALIHQRHEARPDHGFSGRSREMLALERLLLVQPYAVLLGEGKTALACETARWLTLIHRVERVAFVSLEKHTHALTVLYELGQQLVGKGYSATDLEQAFLPVERELRAKRTLLLLDNLETVLPPRPGAPLGAYDAQELAQLLDLFQRLLAVKGTQILFTSRERLPSPFDAERNHVKIGPLAPWDAVEMVKNVLVRAGVPLPKGSSGDSEEALLALVEAVHCHARTLALLAPELAKNGVPDTTAQLNEIMASLERKYPGERERSLYAGVALSLNRLSPAIRQAIRPLGVFQGGGHWVVIANVLGFGEDPQQVLPLVVELAQTGLCDFHENNYLTFHFALCPFLWSEMTVDEQESARQRWLVEEFQFAGFLKQQHFQDTNLSAALTLLDLPNQLAGLEQVANHWSPEKTLAWASALGSVLQNLGKRSAQQRVAEIREGVTVKLGAGWSHVRFNAESQRVDHLGQRGFINEALKAALALLQQCQAAGEAAYDGAPYDLAMAYRNAGRFLSMSGSPAQAIPLLAEARHCFKRLGKEDLDARRMAATVLNDLGDCQMALGLLDQAAESYEQSGQEDEKEQNARGVAVSMGQLGTVRMLQQRYPEALAAHEKARETFTRLNEPASVATAWHQTAIVYRAMQAWSQAEDGFRESLKIKTALKHESGMANTLGELGTLYDQQGRWEEAVVQSRQAAEMYQRLKDPAKEGVVHSNLADTLIKLRRFGEARQAIQRAIELREPFGLAVEPWKSWAILANLESAEGNTQAAIEARSRARELFAQYRRAGGENHEGRAQLCQVIGVAIQQGATAQARQELEQLAHHPQMPPWGKALFPVLLAILDGNRDPALADAPGLNYDDAVEVMLLLERLEKG
ncbi:MAG: tetratricopeptide repeat protein [Magnetococcales bacterium]|nr:tetratricopeptide repeat protein [Magnetococcales bacterium]